LYWDQAVLGEPEAAANAVGSSAFIAGQVKLQVTPESA
jgi:hypothetical protein